MDYVMKEETPRIKYYLLWVGLLIYNFGLLIWDHTMHLGSISILFMVLGMLLSFFSLLFSISIERYKNGGGLGKFTTFIIVFIFFWSFIMLLNSEANQLFNLNSYIFPYKALPYICIIMLFVDINGYIISFFKLSDLMSVLALMLFPLSIINGSNFVQIVFETFCIYSAYVFMTNKYHDKNKVFFALLVLVLSFLTVTYMGRRNLMLTSGLYLLIGVFWLFKDGKFKSIETKIIVCISSFLLLVGGIYYYSSEDTFDTFKGRATSNTREEVFLMYFADMSNVKDIAIGRGIFGEYYGPNVDKNSETEEYSDYREVIECGYLQLILKGGLVYLILYLLILVLAIKKGLKAKNRLIKACVAIIFIQIIDMFPFGLHAFNTKTFLIWLCVAACYSRFLRDMTDFEICKLFFNKKKYFLPWEKK